MKKFVFLVLLASLGAHQAHAQSVGKAGNESQENDLMPESTFTYSGSPMAARDNAVAVTRELFALDESAIEVLSVREYRDATTVDLVVAKPKDADARVARRELLFVFRKAPGNQYGWLITDIKAVTD